MSNAGSFLSDGKQMVKVKTFGDALRMLMAEAGTERHVLTNQVGCTKSDLKDWEENKSFPNNNQLQRLFTIFKRLRYFAQQYGPPGVVAGAGTEAHEAPEPEKPAPAPKAQIDQGELGDLELVAIEHARAMRAHSVAIRALAKARKELDEAEFESNRLAKLVDTLFQKFQGIAHGGT